MMVTPSYLLTKMGDQYIYAPHLAPFKVQQDARCIIGSDYPFPMLDEKAEKEKCLLRLKAAYKLNIYGSHGSVKDGSADKLLKDSYKLELEALDNKSRPDDPELLKQGSKTRKRKAGGSVSNGSSSKTAKKDGIERYFLK